MKHSFRYLIIPHRGSLELTSAGQFHSVMLGDMESLLAAYALPNLTTVTRPNLQGWRKFMGPAGMIRFTDHYLLIRMREPESHLIKPIIAEKSALMNVPVYVYADPELVFDVVTLPGWYRLPTYAHTRFVRAGAELNIPSEWNSPTEVLPVPKLPFEPATETVTLALSHYSPERIEYRGRRVSALKFGTRDGLVAMKVLGEQAQNVSSSRHRYTYLHVEESAEVRLKPGLVLVKFPLSRIAELEYHMLGEGIGSDLFAWGNDQWYEFPNAVTASYRVSGHHRPLIAGSGYFYAASSVTGEPVTSADQAAPPHDFPTQIVGNGMVLSWKRGYHDKPCCWWIEDEKRTSKHHSQTYRYRETIRAAGAKWSSTFHAWYSSREQPPPAWLKLVGYQPPAPQNEDQPPNTTREEKEVIPEFPVAAVAALLEADEMAAGRHYNLPLQFLREQHQRYPNTDAANPTIWARLYSGEQEWIFLVTGYAEAENRVFGHLVQLQRNQRGDDVIIGREWVWKTLNELEAEHVQRTPNFTADNFNYQMYLIEQRCARPALSAEQEIWKVRLQDDLHLRQQALARLKLADEGLPRPVYLLTTATETQVVEVTSTHRFSRFSQETDGVIFYRIVGEEVIQQVAAHDFICRMAAACGNPQQPDIAWQPFAAVLAAFEQQKAEAAQAMTAYEQFKVRHEFQRTWTETLHTLTGTGVKRLSAQVITLDDPWS